MSPGNRALSCNYRACSILEPKLHNKKSHCNGNPVSQNKSSPHSSQLEKALTQQRGPSTAKNNLKQLNLNFEIIVWILKTVKKGRNHKHVIPSIPEKYQHFMNFKTHIPTFFRNGYNNWAFLFSWLVKTLPSTTKTVVKAVLLLSASSNFENGIEFSGFPPDPPPRVHNWKWSQ